MLYVCAVRFDITENLKKNCQLNKVLIFHAFF